MAKSILAASPDTSFSETLRTGLQDAGGYTVQLAASGAEVLASIGNLAFDIAIIDSLISDLPVPALVDAIRLKHPDVKVLVIPPTDPFSELTLEECGADNFLNKPVFIPDLLDIIRGLLKPAEPIVESGETPFESEEPRNFRDVMSNEIAQIDWNSDNLPGSSGNDFPETLVLPLEDVIAATQQHISIPNESKKNTGALQEIPPEQFLMMEELTKWFSESTARSAMLVSGSEVIATSGEMDGELQRKFAHDVSERFQASDARELIRYIPPQKGAGNELLFAASVGAEKFLILTYDAETPYASIRDQAERLHKCLVESVQTPVQPEEVKQAWLAADEMLPTEGSAAPSKPAEIPSSIQAEEVASSSPDEKDFFEEVPEPQPVPIGDGAEEGLALEPFPPVTPSTFNIDEDFPVPELDKEGGSGGSEAEYPWLAAGTAVAAAGALPVAGQSVPEGIPPTFPWESPPEPVERIGEVVETPTPEVSLAEEAQTGESPANETSMEEISRPARVTTAELPANPPTDLRVFLLVPADPRVFLTGKLATELGEWIPQVCQSMSWDVDALAVRPESVRVGLIASPDQKDDLVVGTLQDATARLVAANYPQMALDPDKPLFWADDFLKINPGDPPDQNELNAFIRHLRR